MNKVIDIISTLAIVVFLLAHQMSQAADIIKLTAGFSKPPYVIEKTPDYPGIQLDLINAIFKHEDQPVLFSFLSLSRRFSSPDKWHSDGVITLPKDYQYQGVYVSAPYISYQNVVVTLAQDNLVINDVNDLKGKNIIAFQMAKKFLGKEYVSAVEEAAEYRELSEQMRQIKMLFAKRTQALVLDISIFKHFLHNHREQQYSKPYTVHWLFPPRIYSVGFKDAALRDKFNRGLKKVKASGQYQKIVDKYLL